MHARARSQRGEAHNSFVTQRGRHLRFSIYYKEETKDV